MSHRFEIDPLLKVMILSGGFGVLPIEQRRGIHSVGFKSMLDDWAQVFEAQSAWQLKMQRWVHPFARLVGWHFEQQQQAQRQGAVMRMIDPLVRLIDANNVRDTKMLLTWCEQRIQSAPLYEQLLERLMQNVWRLDQTNETVSALVEHAQEHLGRQGALRMMKKALECNESMDEREALAGRTSAYAWLYRHVKSLSEVQLLESQVGSPSKQEQSGPAMVSTRRRLSL